MLIGYARISTPDQSLEPQLEVLRSAGVEQPQLYSDIASGARTERQGLQDALAYAREGDTLVVWKLDRLGRSLSHLIEVMNSLEQRGIGFKSLTEGFDTTTPGGKLVFNLFGAIAEFERSLIRERTQVGLKAARAKGKKGGRPTSLTPAKQRLMRQMADDPEVTVNDICCEFDISVTTYYRYLSKPDSDKAKTRNQ